MNFDLKRSWLGATLVQQGRGFFSVLVCVGAVQRWGRGYDHSGQSGFQEPHI